MSNKLDALRPQRANLNKHTQRGMGMLERSISEDGWIGAITVAADGETFDGSARLEVVEALGGVEPIVVETDGTRPVVLRRSDIPSADDPRAIRLGLSANRVAQVNLAWDAELLAALPQEATTGLFTPQEVSALVDAEAAKGDQEKKPEQPMQPATCPECGCHFEIALTTRRRK